MDLISRSPAETEALGRLLGSHLARGTFIALKGALGSGKTCFTRGIVSAVAPSSINLVASPTFAIMNEYPGDPPVFHFDFYRLSGGGSEIVELGFEDYFMGEGICIAEWPELMLGILPEKSLTVTIELTGEFSRKIIIDEKGPTASALLEHFSGFNGAKNFL